jgi:hypothetical protein
MEIEMKETFIISLLLAYALGGFVASANASCRVAGASTT